MKTKDVLIGVAKYALGAGLLALVLYLNWDDKRIKANPPEEPADRVQPGLKTIFTTYAPDPALAVAAVGLMVVVVGFQYYRWYLLVRAVGLPFTVKEAARLGLVGTFANAFLPGAIGGDILKAYYLVRDNKDRWSVAIATVFIDRLLGLFGLMLLAAVVGGASWAAGDPAVAQNNMLKGIVTGTGIGVGVMVGGWVLLGLLPPKVLDGVGRLLARVKKLAEAWDAVRLYRTRSKTIYLAVLLSAVSHVCMVLLFHVAVRVFPLPNPGTLAEHAVVAPAGFIGQVFVPVPGGVGGAEYIFGKLYKAIGRDETVGVVGRLTLRMAEWLIGLAGFAYYVRAKRALPGEAPAPAPSLADGRDAERLAGPVQG